MDTKQQALSFVRLLASYGCAEQEPDKPVCGTCGPCQAATFLRELPHREELERVKRKRAQPRRRR